MEEKFILGRYKKEGKGKGKGEKNCNGRKINKKRKNQQVAADKFTEGLEAEVEGLDKGKAVWFNLGGTERGSGLGVGGA